MKVRKGTRFLDPSFPFYFFQIYKSPLLLMQIPTHIHRYSTEVSLTWHYSTASFSSFDQGVERNFIPNANSKRKPTIFYRAAVLANVRGHFTYVTKVRYR
jgi:hypothetical protein